MPQLSERYFKTAVIFLIAGIAAGLQMAISGNHNVIVAHAHANLLGWVSMAIFGGYLALNPAKARGRFANLQYWIYTVSVVILSATLYLMYQGYMALEPIAAVSSIGAFAGVLMFAVMVFSQARERRTAPSDIVS